MLYIEKKFHDAVGFTRNPK